MDEAQCLSDRSLRYGRNIMVICFIACGVKFFAADFTEASLFGIKVQEQQFWAVLLFLLIWHLVYFVILVNDNIQNWWNTYVTAPYPSSRFVTYLWAPPESLTVGKKKYTINEDPPYFKWEWQRGRSISHENVPLPTHKQTRRTILRVLLLDAGFPILFSLFTILLVVQEWLSLAFWKFVVDTLF